MPCTTAPWTSPHWTTACCTTVPGQFGADRGRLGPRRADRDRFGHESIDGHEAGRCLSDALLRWRSSSVISSRICSSCRCSWRRGDGPRRQLGDRGQSVRLSPRRVTMRIGSDRCHGRARGERQELSRPGPELIDRLGAAFLGATTGDSECADDFYDTVTGCWYGGSGAGLHRSRGDLGVHCVGFPTATTYDTAAHGLVAQDVQQGPATVGRPGSRAASSNMGLSLAGDSRTLG